MRGPLRAHDQNGMITLWILGLVIAVMFLGGLGLDLWRAVAVRREVSTMADAAATAGADGLDENALRGDALQLDDTRVRQLVAAELAEYPNAQRLEGEEVTIAGARVSVSLRETVHFSLLGIFMGGGRFVVRATATAEPREVP
jgi:Putative Flp pilus-assembly TadE/G-like